LEAAEKVLRFFYRVFELTLLRNPKKRDKKNRPKQPRTEGEEKKRRKQNRSRIFCDEPPDEPRWIFLIFMFFLGLNSPCYETMRKFKK
jgi:hypothetical protein